MRRRRPNGSVLLSILLTICIVLLAANLWRLNQPPRPDLRMVGLAVRATLFAVPTPTPRVIEVTRVVQVTAVPPTPTATGAPTVTPMPTSTLTSTPTEAALSQSLPANAPEMEDAILAATLPEEAAADAQAVSDSEVFVEEAAAQQVPDEQPPAAPEPAPCPAASGATFTTVPVEGGGLNHPDALHADLNLALRGYTPANIVSDLFNKDGPVDSDPPQLAGIFTDYRRPPFGQAYRVNDWDWSCGDHGCPLGPLEQSSATLITLQANAGEALGIPHRGAQIYGGGYKALVLYAEATRITLGFTREDSVANGYAVHLENMCVDPNLVALYQSSNAAGRGFLPALREDEVLGTTGDGSVVVAVRDRGVFLDPQSRLDWWQGF